MKAQQQYRDQTVDELKALYTDLSRDIFTLRCENSLHRKLEKPHLLRQKKRERARVLTFLRQKGGRITG
jgi:large subunit ribosomal protein L29